MSHGNSRRHFPLRTIPARGGNPSASTEIGTITSMSGDETSTTTPFPKRSIRTESGASGLDVTRNALPSEVENATGISVRPPALRNFT